MDTNELTKDEAEVFEWYSRNVSGCIVSPMFRPKSRRIGNLIQLTLSSLYIKGYVLEGSTSNFITFSEKGMKFIIQLRSFNDL